MKATKEYFDQNFLCGLHLLLEQLQLSIHRSSSHDWNDLVKYLANRAPIEEVLEKLKSTNALEGWEVSDITRPPPSNRIWITILGRRGCLSSHELLFIYSKLLKTKNLLKKSNFPEIDTRIQIRLDVYHAANIVSSKLARKMLKTNSYVEHFNQNYFLDCKSINELVGEQWF